MPVTYQLYSAEEDTYATAPMIQLDTQGHVRTWATTTSTTSD